MKLSLTNAKTVLTVWLSLTSFATFAAAPTVTNVRAAQRVGTHLVDVYFNLANPGANNTLSISAVASVDGGLTYSVVMATIRGAVGPGVTAGNDRLVTWNAETDWPGQSSAQCRIKIVADNGSGPPGNTGQGISGGIRIDTRFSGSASDAASGLFTVDTQSATVGIATIAGHVTDPNGVALGGVAINLLQNSVLRAQTSTDGNGNYLLTSLPPAAAYRVTAIKPSFVDGWRVGISVGSAQNLTVNFVLDAIPNPPSTHEVSNAPQETQIRTSATPTPDQLKLFVGVDGTFQSGRHLDRSKMTIIMTHGWRSSPDEWAKAMAARMTAKGITTNIVAWDWTLPAVGTIPPVDETQRQGLALGKALYDELGANYAQKVHFLGHSLGTLVNARAANFLHGDGERDGTRANPAWVAARTHMTLFDEAEVASVGGQNVLYTAGEVTVSAANAALTPTPANGVETAVGAAVLGAVLYDNWRSPIPKNSAWIDNYISLVGIHHKSAVNVYLRQGGFRTGFDIFTYHSYPMVWYGKSVDAVDTPAFATMGYRNTFERNLSLPPSAAYANNTVYVQEVLAPTELSLDLITTDASAADKLLLQSGNFTITVFSLGVTAGKTVVNWGLNYAGRVAAVPVVSVLRNYEGTLNPFADPVGITTPSTIGPVGGINGQNATSADLQLRFQTDPDINPTPLPSGIRKSDTGGTTNRPAYAWLSLDVPPASVFVSFNYTLSGDGKSDYLAFGIDGTNVFKMEADFIEDGIPSNSGLIDISRYAGKTVELFFGLLGGTSTNAVLTVEGIRFHQLTPPAISLAQAGTKSVVTWPYSAPGYLLEGTSQLGGTNVWSVIATNASVVDFRHTVTNDATPGSRFFRLRKQ